jgi:hypothetical protein
MNAVWKFSSNELGTYLKRGLRGVVRRANQTDKPEDF